MVYLINSEEYGDVCGGKWLKKTNKIHAVCPDQFWQEYFFLIIAWSYTMFSRLCCPKACLFIRSMLPVVSNENNATQKKVSHKEEGGQASRHREAWRDNENYLVHGITAAFIAFI